MVSYVDVLTILLILFMAAAARALQAPPPAPVPSHTVERPALPTPAIRPPAEAPPPDPVQEALTQQGLDLRREKWGLVISLPQAVLFPCGDDRIPESALPVVDEIASVLRTIPNKVNLAGNADSVPIRNRRFHNNWELSAARGMALLDLLVAKYGIDESRLSVTSNGSYSPRESNDSSAGRAANRRVEITILDQTN